MAIRITKKMQYAIALQLIEHRFAKGRKALVDTEHALAERIHKLRYPPVIFKQMESLPSGWMPTVTTISVTHRENRCVLSLKNPLPVMAVDQHAAVMLTKLKSPGTASAIIALTKFADAAKERSDHIRQLRSDTMSALAGFRTIKALLLAWPDIKPIVDKLGYSDEKKSLPAIIPAGLNARLGLPIKEAA